MRKITKRTTAIIAASVIAVGGAGAAWAAWTFSGKGSANVSAATAVPLNVGNLSVAGPLVPGAAASVTFTVNNDNDFPVIVNSMTYGNVSSTPSACAGQIQQVSGAPLPGSRDLKAHETKTYTYTNSLKLVDDPATQCQGAAYSFDVTVGATSDQTAP